MLEGVADANALQKLKADILNATPWEESWLRFFAQGAK